MNAYWFLPMIVCILLQTTGEDVFFKGFLLRQFGGLCQFSGSLLYL